MQGLTLLGRWQKEPFSSFLLLFTFGTSDFSFIAPLSSLPLRLWLSSVTTQLWALTGLNVIGGLVRKGDCPNLALTRVREMGVMVSV